VEDAQDGRRRSASPLSRATVRSRSNSRRQESGRSNWRLPRFRTGQPLLDRMEGEIRPRRFYHDDVHGASRGAEHHTGYREETGRTVWGTGS